MEALDRDSKPNGRRSIRRFTSVVMTVASLIVAYDYWANEGQAGAVVALVGASLLLTLLVCIPVLVRRRGE